MSVTTSGAIAVRLVGTKADVVRHLRVMAERGRAIRQGGTETFDQLADLRRKTQEWTADASALLTRTFDSRSIAEGFNEAIVGSTADQGDLTTGTAAIAEELDQRVGRLSLVLRRVEQMVEVAAAPPASTTEFIVTAPGYSAPRAPGYTEAVNIQSPAARTAAQTFVLLTHEGLASEGDVVGEFATKLGLGVARITPEAGVSPIRYSDTLAPGSFAVVAVPRKEAAAFSHASTDAVSPETAFELGFICGRVGANRLVVVYPANGTSSAPAVDGFTDANGITFIPLDVAGGWLLSLARQMKKAGVEIDLNRVL